MQLQYGDVDAEVKRRMFDILERELGSIDRRFLARIPSWVPGGLGLVARVAENGRWRYVCTSWRIDPLLGLAGLIGRPL